MENRDGCPKDCGHTRAEHRAFDNGVIDGRLGKKAEACSYSSKFSPDLYEAWQHGHSVGVMDRQTQ